MTPTPLWVLLVFGDQAELVIPQFHFGTDNPLRVPAADITAATGLTTREMPGRHLTALVTETPEVGVQVSGYALLPKEEQPEDSTRPHPIRINDPWWEAYGRICGRLGTNRSADVNAHIEAMIREHGDEQDLAALEAGKVETTGRLDRKNKGRAPGTKNRLPKTSD